MLKKGLYIGKCQIGVERKKDNDEEASALNTKGINQNACQRMKSEIFANDQTDFIL